MNAVIPRSAANRPHPQTTSGPSSACAVLARRSITDDRIRSIGRSVTSGTPANCPAQYVSQRQEHPRDRPPPQHVGLPQGVVGILHRQRLKLGTAPHCELRTPSSDPPRMAPPIRRRTRCDGQRSLLPMRHQQRQTKSTSNRQLNTGHRTRAPPTQPTRRARKPRATPTVHQPHQHPARSWNGPRSSDG